MFRWGLVGFGWVARDHMLPGLLAAGHRVAGVVDPGAEPRAAAGAAGLRVFDGLDALIAARPDAVYVATPNHRHAEPVMRLAGAGVPVLCEKPMAAHRADAETMAAAVRGKVYGTAFDQRWHPAHRAIAALVDGGAVGRVTAVRVAYACWVDACWSPTGAANWRAEADSAGGGATIDLALHGLDLAQMLLRSPLDRLQMVLQRRVHPYAVDDGGAVAGRFANGALYQAHVAYNCPEALPRRRLEVLGELGQITATDTMGQTAGGRVTLTDGATGVETGVDFDRDTSPFAAQAAGFAAYARDGGDAFDIERDIELMRMFDAAHREALRWL